MKAGQTRRCVMSAKSVLGLSISGTAVQEH
jgi:hypothetical protein